MRFKNLWSLVVCAVILSASSVMMAQDEKDDQKEKGRKSEWGKKGGQDEEMQKQIDSLKKQMGNMQAEMDKMRLRLQKLARSGSPEDFRKFSEEFSKQFGGGGGQTPEDAEEEKPAKKKQAKKKEQNEEEEKPAKKKQAKKKQEEDEEDNQMPSQPRVWLGMDGQETDDGFEITGFRIGSPAKKAGLKKGDVLTKFNGESVTSAQEIVAAEIPIKPGSKVKVVVLRGGKEMEIEVTLEKRPSEPAEPEDEDEGENDKKKDDKKKEEK